MTKQEIIERLKSMLQMCYCPTVYSGGHHQFAGMDYLDQCDNADQDEYPDGFVDADCITLLIKDLEDEE